MPLVDVQDITDRLPDAVLPLADGDLKRVRVLIGDAEQLIRDEFDRAGLNFDGRLRLSWFENTVKRAIREMVSAAVHVGGSVGQRSASSTTGPQSDAVTWADVDSVSWSGVKLTDALRVELGLLSYGPRWSFPEPSNVPEVMLDGRSRDRHWG